MSNPKRTICKICKVSAFEEGGEVWCPSCENKRQYAAATLRAHYDAVYLAEVGSGSGLGTAHTNALESVRTHAARMAELEAVIAEGAGNG